MALAEHRRPLGQPFMPRTDNGVDPTRSALLSEHAIDLGALKDGLKAEGQRRRERFAPRSLDAHLADVVMAAEKEGNHSNLYVSSAGHLRRAIEQAGVTAHDWGTDYKFFSGRADRNQVIGNNDILEGIVEFVTAREKGIGNENRILLIIGKPGSGKSTVVDAIKAGFEEYARSSDPAISAISGCPINEDPLNILSLLTDSELKEALPSDHKLCPDCQERLRREYDSDPTRFTVEAIDVSNSQGNCITKLEPDITTGQRNTALSLIGDSDRGILEISEYSQHNDGFRKALAEILSTRTIQIVNIDPKSYEPVRREYRIDHTVIATTTFAEWEALRKRLEQEFPGELRRITEIYWPFVTSVKDETAIYEKAKDLSDFKTHVSTKALELLAKIALRTRLTTTPHRKNGTEVQVTPEDKLVLYDGKNTTSLTQADRRIIQRQARRQNEGMDGLPPTFMIDVLFGAMAENPQCVSAIEALKACEEFIRNSRAKIPSELKKTPDDLVKLVTQARNEYDIWQVETVRKALRPDYDEAVQTHFITYMNNIELYLQPNDPEVIASLRSTDIFNAADDIVVADESFMGKVEEAGGISQNAKKAFRENQIVIGATIARSGGRTKYELDAFPELKRAIEAKIGAEIDKTLLELFTTRAPNKDQVKQIEDTKQELIDKYGFCPHCVDGGLKLTEQMLRKLAVSEAAKKT